MGVLERLKMREQAIKAAIYARFSSDNQRSESIDAQIRAMRDFAHANNIIIVAEYIDKAKSAMTDDRPQFQNMIKDSSKKNYELLLVHKLDRFARNRNDSIMNRAKLRRNGVALLSITEPLDDEKPESIILEAVLEAMAEYYSKNLAREVRKGLKENALKCKHTGGMAPLGYNVDKESRRLIINTEEARAVKLIYQMIIQGHGYNAILTKLRLSGYKTKAGRDFGKNSLYEILRNPKYKGIYVYNRVAEADPYTRSRNSHQWNSEEDMIIVPDGVPAIISKEDFDLVQKILSNRSRDSKDAKHHKEVYLLAGKIFCGDCGCRYAGNRKNSTGNKGPNITYRCNNRARRTGISCRNKEVNRDYLESFVLKKIEVAVFNKKMVSIIIDKFQEHIRIMNTEKNEILRRLEKEVRAVEVKQNNLSDILAEGCTDTLQQKILLQKLKSLEVKKVELLEQMEQEKLALELDAPDKRVLEECFIKARRLFRAKQLEEQQVLINLYVERVVVHQDQIEVILNLVPSFYRQAFTNEVHFMTRSQLRSFFYNEEI